MKKIMKSSVIGISIALIIFTMIGIIFDIGYGGTFLMKGYSFTKMAIGSILVGIGFGAPSAIYENDALPYPLQVIFHMGIGMAVMFIVSFVVIDSIITWHWRRYWIYRSRCRARNADLVLFLPPLPEGSHRDE